MLLTVRRASLEAALGVVSETFSMPLQLALVVDIDHASFEQVNSCGFSSLLGRAFGFQLTLV